MKTKERKGKEKKMKNKNLSKRVNLKENKAITLIALVVTIVVLLILAGISLNLVLGQNGIITRAQEAKTKTEQDSARTSFQLIGLEWQTEQYIGGEDLETYLASKVTSGELDNYEEADADGSYTIEKGGYATTINADGTIGDIETATAKPKVTVKVVDASGNEITGAKSSDAETLYVVLTASLDGGTITTSSDQLKIAVTKNGTYEYTVEGKLADGTVVSKTVKVTVNQFQPQLKVGSTVTYTPASGQYTWAAEYCSTSKTSDTVLKNTDSNYAITSWKVLAIDETAGTVTLVPSAPTTGIVYLGQAQGYNNGVKLLNDACSTLYSDSSKGITARSINIEDIEKYMTDDALNNETTGAHNYQYSSSTAKYGTKLSSAYSKSNSYYPAIYEQEKQSVINGTEATSGLGLSEQTSLIGRTQATSLGKATATAASSGYLQASTSINPYQTYWYKNSTFMSTAFKAVDSGAVSNYYSLIMPKGTSTTYWVASRCVDTDSGYCSFDVRIVRSGDVGAYDMFDSYSDTGGGGLALFPVVSLSSSLISGNATDGFTVE